MKFIHTSDWHIGRQFHNVSLLEDQRHVLNQLLRYIQEETVDALVIAGDVYDRSVPPATAVSLLDDTLTKICSGLGVPVILIPGNHDSAERLSFGSRQLSKAGLHIIGDLQKITEPVVIKGVGGELNFYGIPYNDPETVRNLFDQQVATYEEAHRFLVGQISRQKADGVANILISHCFIDGATVCDSERPLSIGGSDRVSYEPCAEFDYVALGHLHSPQYKGKEHIRYSGSLLKYSFSEVHQTKGVTLVEFENNKLHSVKQLPLHPLRNMRVIEGNIETIVGEGKTDPNNKDYVLVRLLDQHAILEPMAKLRAVYPNVLQLEKPGMLESGEQQLNRDRLKRGELEMFSDFFDQITGRQMSEEQNEAIKQTIRELHSQQD